MKQRHVYSLLVLLIALAAIIWYVNSGKKISSVREAAVAPETIGGVGIDGTRGDAELNREKNRFTKPLDVSDLTIEDILHTPVLLLEQAGKHKRKNWSQNATEYAEEEEHRGVRVEGYLVHAKESGPESCNGYSDSLRDYHIWISQNPTNDKSDGMIVEITPRWKVAHPNWRLHTIERLADDHARVRVTGWLLWDEEHPEEVGKSRATQWEIHPVTDFEVYSGSDWKSLDSY
jgi:hypothetical protein